MIKYAIASTADWNALSSEVQDEYADHAVDENLVVAMLPSTFTEDVHVDVFSDYPVVNTITIANDSAGYTLTWDMGGKTVSIDKSGVWTYYRFQGLYERYNGTFVRLQSGTSCYIYNTASGEFKWHDIVFDGGGYGSELIDCQNALIISMYNWVVKNAVGRFVQLVSTLGAGSVIENITIYNHTSANKLFHSSSTQLTIRSSYIDTDGASGTTFLSGPTIENVATSNDDGTIDNISVSSALVAAAGGDFTPVSGGPLEVMSLPDITGHTDYLDGGTIGDYIGAYDVSGSSPLVPVDSNNNNLNVIAANFILNGGD